MTTLWRTSILLLFLTTAIHAQTLVTSGQRVLVPDSSPTMNSQRKQLLSQSISGRAFHGAVYLPAGTLVKVLSSNKYDLRETGGPNANTVKRTYDAKFVEVVDGEHQGTSGWVVGSVQEDNGRTTAFLKAAPGNYQAQKEASAAASAELRNTVDLVATISRGDKRMQVAGKEVLSVSVANVGGVTADGIFSVLVELDGKQLHNERIRGPLRPGGSSYFNVEVSESAIRRGGTLTVRVDSDNRVEEGNETNNVVTQRF